MNATRKKIDDLVCEARGEAVAFVLDVLETGCSLHDASPWEEFILRLGRRHDALCKRINVLRDCVDRARLTSTENETPDDEKRDRPLAEEAVGGTGTSRKGAGSAPSDIG